MITQFALLLSHGMSLMWCLMPRQQVTSGFFRIQSLIVLGLSVLAFLAAGQLNPGQPRDVSTNSWSGLQIISLVTGVCAYFSSVFWRLEARSAGTVCLWVMLVTTMAALISSAQGFTAAESSRAAIHVLLHLLSLWSSAAVLGGATTGMLLGHWYLTAPTMSIEPLKRLTWILFAALLVRLAVSACGWLDAGGLIQGSLLWTWMALRWLAGILAPLVLAVMTDRILRYRNTQAATGVLFAAVILVFLGEMSAALLYAELGRAL